MIRLTNEQWERIRKHFPEEHIADGRPGRKPIPTRHVLEAVLWILNTGAQWHMLPQSARWSSAFSLGYNGNVLSSSDDFEIGSRYYYLAILYPSLGEALHLVIKGGNEHGLDDSDHSRDLHRPRDQRLSAARVLSNVCRPRLAAGTVLGSPLRRLGR